MQWCGPQGTVEKCNITLTANTISIIYVNIKEMMHLIHAVGILHAIVTGYMGFGWLERTVCYETDCQCRLFLSLQTWYKFYGVQLIPTNCSVQTLCIMFQKIYITMCLHLCKSHSYKHKNMFFYCVFLLSSVNRHIRTTTTVGPRSSSLKISKINKNICMDNSSSGRAANSSRNSFL